MIHPDIATQIATIREALDHLPPAGDRARRDHLDTVDARQALDALETLLDIPDSHGPGHIELDDPIAGLASDLGLDDTVTLADHISTAAVVARAPAVPPAGLLTGVVLTAWCARKDGSMANTPARVFLMGTPDHLRRMGNVVRDALRQAANVGEKGVGG